MDKDDILDSAPIGLFEDEELEIILEMMMEGAGTAEVSSVDIALLMKEFHQYRVNAALLNLVLMRLVYPSVSESGEVLFRKKPQV